MSVEVETQDENIHVVPKGDGEPEHEQSANCFCRPLWDPENRSDYVQGIAEKKVYVHNRMGMH